MELLTHRYRAFTVLVVAVVAQLLLLGFQVRNQQDMRLVRVWAVTAITPMARVLETARRSVTAILDRYVFLVGAAEENRHLKGELGQLKLEAAWMRRELATADRAQALALFSARNPSRIIAARIIGAGAGTDSQVLFVDRGAGDGVIAGMAVITPDGVVGRVSAAYATASQVVLITDPRFAAGVIAQRSRVEGTVKGRGQPLCTVDYLRNDQDLRVGDWFYTSGDDRVFPRGLPVGQVQAIDDRPAERTVFLSPSGMKEKLEEVLIVIEGVHQPIPPAKPVQSRMPLLAPPPATGPPTDDGNGGEHSPPATGADRLMLRYRAIGKAQKHVFGEGTPGTPPPNFNLAPVRPATAGTSESGTPESKP